MTNLKYVVLVLAVATAMALPLFENTDAPNLLETGQETKGVQTEAGRFSRTYWSTGHIFEKDNSKVRTQLLRVKFINKFNVAPVVGAALTGFDLAFDNAAVRLTVLRTTTEYFIVRITAPAKAFVYFVGVSYIATVSNAIDISVIDQSAQGVITVANPGTYKAPGAISFISGFEFGAGANIRLRTLIESVDKKNTKVKVESWADTKLNRFVVTVLHFDKDVDDQDTADLSVSGVKNVQTKTASIAVDPTKEFFIALNYIDFINTHNYRLSQKFSLAGGQLTAAFSTWADTELYKTDDIVFWTSKFVTTPQLATQVGAFSKTYWSTGHIFERDGGAERTEKIAVNFPVAYAVAPKVALVLSGLDLAFNNAAVRVQATDITPTGFKVQVIAPKGALVYLAAANWLATTDPRIEVQRAFIDSARGDLDGKDRGKVSFSVSPVSSFKKPDVALFLSGFRFGSANNARLRVVQDKWENNAINFYVGTWADTIWEAADIVIVFFNSGRHYGEDEIGSATTGSIYGGSNPRSDTQFKKINTADHLVLQGLNHLDFIWARNYRLTQGGKQDGENWSITYNTWGDTAVWLVKDTVFWCPAAV